MPPLDDSPAPSLDVPTPQEFRHIRELQRGLFGLAAVGSVVALIVETWAPSTPLPPGERSLTLTYLAVTAVVAWLSLWRHRYGHVGWWAAGVAFAALGTEASSLDYDRPGPVLAGMLVTLLWSGLLLRARYNAVLACSIVPLLAVHGASFDGGGVLSSGGYRIPFAVLMIYGTIPVVVGAGIQRASALLSTTLLLKLERAHARQQQLAERLRRHTDELQESRARLVRARKLETVGTMASGLAHELNNILTPVRGLGELLASGLVSQEQAQLYGRRILKSAVAAGRITSSLLAYTWQGPFQPVRTNAKEFLALELLPELAKQLPHGVQLDARLDTAVWVDVDRMQFQHCVTNLVLNAADAMPDGGPIRINLRLCHTNESTTGFASNDDAPTHRAARPSNTPSPLLAAPHAELTVCDRGMGIAPEDLEHIFDPFFTTKAIGAGTGLGLAFVQGSITRHGGSVHVESTRGEGTCFTIRLPVAATPSSDTSESAPADDWDAVGPTVLVVMEDVDELDELEELLAQHDCSPLCCSDPNRAPELVADMATRVQVLVLDLETKTVDMREMYRLLRERYPKLPIVLLSSEPTSAKNRSLISGHPTRSVRKPVEPRTLPALLQALLTGRDQEESS